LARIFQVLTHRRDSICPRRSQVPGTRIFGYHGVLNSIRSPAALAKLPAETAILNGEMSAPNRAIVNTVSLLRLVPVALRFDDLVDVRQRLARAHIRNVVLRPRHVHDDHLHAMLLGGRSHLVWPSFRTVS